MDNQMQKEEYIEIDLLRIIGALWRSAWIIVLAVLVCGAAGFLVARYAVTPTYQASTLMYVNNSSFSVGSTSVSLSDLNASKSLVNTYMVILKTRLTLNEVILKEELPYSYEELVGMIEAAAVSSTEIFRITVTSTDPVEAKRIANAISEILPDKISDIVDGCSVRIVDIAVTPARPAASSITRFTAIGLLAGLLLSSVVIALSEIFNDQIHDEDDLTQSYGLPVLAAIPNLQSKPGKGARAYRGYGREYKKP